MTVTSSVTHRVQWMEWGQEVFERARREDKLIVLDSGAKWCHWCHVMDRLTYEDAEVVALLNESFVPVRIDRDRLPEVDARYQRAVPAIPSGGNGWPLTVVITPEGHVLFKATFLPPRAEAAYGQAAGLIELLGRLDAYWRSHRRRLASAADRARRLEDEAAAVPARPGRLGPQPLEVVTAGIQDAYDVRHGGFGGAPKFFAVPAIDLLLARAWSGDAPARQMAVRTLEAIFRGGVHDHLGGGFHRYSVDERWHVPHFEKMAYDNAALLTSYCNAYALTGQKDFARAARRTLAWVSRVLTAPHNAGFYASQDADVGLDDDGDYFTWTADEVRQVLDGQSDVILSYYGVDEQGDVHGRHGRNVLHTPKTLAQQAVLTGTDEGGLAALVEQAESRLLRARRQRPAPAVDKTVFADLNGMMIDAHLTAFERLGRTDARDKALAVLDHHLENLRDERGVFAHYRDGRLRGTGRLADQAWMLRALVHAYAVTIRPQYLTAARQVADFVKGELVAPNGGLRSAPASATTHPAAVPPRQRWDDAPSRSAASVAAQALVDLGYLTGDESYSAAGIRALESAAGGIDRRTGVFFAGWAAAAEHALHGPRTIVIVGPLEDGATEDLARAARSAYVPGGLVLALDPALPAHAALLKRLGHAAQVRPVAYVCAGKTCLRPAATAEELKQRLAELARLPGSPV